MNKKNPATGNPSAYSKKSQHKPISVFARTRSTIVFAAVLLSGILSTQSCTDAPAPDFVVGAPTINQGGYTAPSTLSLQYSVDGGKTYSTTVPRLPAGTVLNAKVVGGGADLSVNDFSFDWSATTPAPSASTVDRDVADITVSGGDVTINVTVSDLYSLVSSNSGSGKFYSIDPLTGAPTEAFTPSHNGQVLNRIQAFSYHPRKNRFYASVHQSDGAVAIDLFYSINPTTKASELLNSTNSPGDFVSNWAVAADDNLISLTYRDDSESTFINWIGTDGKKLDKSKKVYDHVSSGLLYNPTTNSVLFGLDNGSSYFNNFSIRKANATTGAKVDDTVINIFSGFQGSFEPSSGSAIKGIVDANSANELFALLFDDSSSSKKTYFVKINLSTQTATFISTIGVDGDNRYNNLTWIPNYAF